MVRPKIAGNGRGLATGGGGGPAPSASGGSSPPRRSTPGSSAMPSVRPRVGHGLRLNGKERYGFSSRSNPGRYRTIRKGNSSRKGKTGPRKWDPKAREFKRTPRKYYRSCMGEGTRKIGRIERIIWRISGLNRRERSKSLGKGENRRSR